MHLKDPSNAAEQRQQFRENVCTVSQESLCSGWCPFRNLLSPGFLLVLSCAALLLPRSSVLVWHTYTEIFPSQMISAKHICSLQGLEFTFWSHLE